MVIDRTLDDATAAGIAIAASNGCPADAVDEATGLLQAADLTVYVIDDAPGLGRDPDRRHAGERAVDALHKGVASAADIDTAMRLGTNYPLGPLAWGQRWDRPRSWPCSTPCTPGTARTATARPPCCGGSPPPEGT